MNEKQKDVVIIYSTFPSKDEARRIGAILVKGKLAACVNIFDKIESIYVWEGDVKNEAECAAFIKTTFQHSDKLTKKLKQLHPYDVPAIVVIDPMSTDPDYAKWLQDQVL